MIGRNILVKSLVEIFWLNHIGRNILVKSMVEIFWLNHW